MIFDEPTAHLDIETELELKEHMLTLMEGKLVFLATHRLHWLPDMDTILFLQNGRLIAQGDLETLRTNKAFTSFVSAVRKPTQYASQTKDIHQYDTSAAHKQEEGEIHG